MSERDSQSPRSYRCERCEHDFVAVEPRCPRCLRVTTIVERAPAPVVDEWQHASSRQYDHAHHVANTIVLGLMVPLHGLCALGIMGNVLRAALGAMEVPPDAPGQIGFYGAFACFAVWSALGLPWALVAAVGIGLKKPWARTLGIAYWAFSCIACCPIPFAVYAIWWLSSWRLSSQPSRPAS